MRSMQKNLSSGIPFSSVLSKIYYKKHPLRSIEKNNSVSPHFSPKMVSHKQLFYIDRNHIIFPQKTQENGSKRIPKNKFFCIDRIYATFTHPDDFLHTSDTKKSCYNSNQGTYHSLVLLATAPRFTINTINLILHLQRYILRSFLPNSYIHSFTDL